MSLRPFFFLAYLSESGRIYVGSQYLGTFGGYGKLERTLRLFLPSSKDRIASISFRHDGSSYKGAKPKEVRVSFLHKPKEITGAQKFGQYGAMAFKRSYSKDEEFNTKVSTHLLAKLGQPKTVFEEGHYRHASRERIACVAR